MRNGLFLPLLLLKAFVLVTACGESSDENQVNTVANLELASIRNDLDLYNSLAAKKDGDEALKLKVAQSILRHVMLVRNTNPKIESLRGEPLETICLLTEPDTRKKVK